MANNRYFLYCPCGSVRYLGKSLGDGIYNVSTASGTPNSWTLKRHEGMPVITPAETNEPEGSGYGRFLEEVYEWMWEHLMNPECYEKRVEQGLHPEETSLSPEWVKGEVFKVITEYDDRVE